MGSADADTHPNAHPNFGEAFGVTTARTPYVKPEASDSSEFAIGGQAVRPSYDENIRLAPYAYRMEPDNLSTVAIHANRRGTGSPV